MEIEEKDKKRIINLYFNRVYPIKKIVDELGGKYSYLDIKFFVLRVINGANR